MLHGVIKKKLCPELGHLGEIWSLAFLWAFDFYFFLALIRYPSSLKCNDLYICPHLQVQSLGGDTSKNCLVWEFPWGAGVKTKSHSSLNKWLHAEGCSIWKNAPFLVHFDVEQALCSLSALEYAGGKGSGVRSQEHPRYRSHCVMLLAGNVYLSPKSFLNCLNMGRKGCFEAISLHSWSLPGTSTVYLSSGWAFSRLAIFSPWPHKFWDCVFALPHWA